MYAQIYKSSNLGMWQMDFIFENPMQIGRFVYRIDNLNQTKWSIFTFSILELLWKSLV